MIVVSFSYGGCDGRVSSRSPHYSFCPGCLGFTRIKGDTFLPLYDEILITTVTGIVVSGRVFCIQALWNLLWKAISKFEVLQRKSENIECTFVSQASLELLEVSGGFITEFLELLLHRVDPTCMKKIRSKLS